MISEEKKTQAIGFSVTYILCVFGLFLAFKFNTRPSPETESVEIVESNSRGPASEEPEEETEGFNYLDGTDRDAGFDYFEARN